MKNLDKIISVNPDKPQPDLIVKAADLISAGGCVCIPTRCLYGLAVDAFNSAAVDRIFNIKQRSVQKPLLVLIDKTDQLDRLVEHVPATASAIMEKYWPGNVTLVLAARKNLPPGLTAGTGRIGVRQTAYPVSMALAAAVRGPISGTSANLSGKAGCYRIEDMDCEILDQIDLTLDAGPLKGGVGSTVVDVTGEYPRIIREGSVSTKDIDACTGLDKK